MAARHAPAACPPGQPDIRAWRSGAGPSLTGSWTYSSSAPGSSQPQAAYAAAAMATASSADTPSSWALRNPRAKLGDPATALVPRAWSRYS